MGRIYVGIKKINKRKLAFYFLKTAESKTDWEHYLILVCAAPRLDHHSPLFMKSIMVLLPLFLLIACGN